ncbi:MAG: dihydrolipoamide dehydrogenase [Spirochaetes bacterium]|nr:MAG: dihydrolipoamide dehydrogenase [Spirochaetota bacterium]
MQEKNYDVVVLGAGPGGYVAAIRAAQLGLSAAVVEKDKPGGVCLNIGCIPSKALIHSAQIFSEGLGLLRAGGAVVDLSGFSYKGVWQASRLAADRLSKGILFLLKKNKVDLVQGRGRLADARTVMVEKDGETILLKARAVILATGSRPRALPGFALDEKNILSSTGMLLSETLPKSMTILGAGAIGMEFAYVLSSFGVKVTVVELLDQVLPLEDPESAKVVEKAFSSRGVEIHTQAKAEKAEVKSDGVHLYATLRDGSSADIVSERLLVSIGRSPNTEDIGLENLGVRMNRGYVETGNFYETSAEGIYAIGDITIQPQLAHVASKAGEIASERIAQVLLGTAGAAGAKESRINPYTIPSAVYCQPEVASFGLSEKKAKDLGVRHVVARFPYRGIGKAVATEAAEGQVKLVYAPDTGAILGVSIAGAAATEIVHELLLASCAELTIDEVSEMIHAHPTISEGVMEAAKAGLGRAIHA